MEFNIDYDLLDEILGLDSDWTLEDFLDAYNRD